MIGITVAFFWALLLGTGLYIDIHDVYTAIEIGKGKGVLHRMPD